MRAPADDPVVRRMMAVIVTPFRFIRVVEVVQVGGVEPTTTALEIQIQFRHQFSFLTAGFHGIVSGPYAGAVAR